MIIKFIKRFQFILNRYQTKQPIAISAVHRQPSTVNKIAETKTPDAPMLRAWLGVEICCESVDTCAAKLTDVAAVVRLGRLSGQVGFAL